MTCCSYWTRWAWLLRGKQEAIDILKEREARRALLPDRKAKLVEYWVDISDDDILDMESAEFQAFFNQKRAEYLDAQEQKIIAEKAKLEAEQREREEFERVEREIKEAEERAKIEAEQKAQREKEEAEKRHKEELARVEREKQEELAKAERERQEELLRVEREKQEEIENLKTEQLKKEEEKIKIEEAKIKLIIPQKNEDIMSEKDFLTRIIQMCRYKNPDGGEFETSEDVLSAIQYRAEERLKSI